jgi:tetratricopeptide (TPR) repeat protein
LGDTIHAINSFEKSYRLGLKKTNYYYNLGLLYLINKDIEASKKSFKIACSSGINSACKMIDFIKKYKNLQTLYYKNHFTICFPEDFCFSSIKNDILLKLQALDKGLLAFQRFSIVEFDTKNIIEKSNNKQSIFDCPITQLVANMQKQVKDFKLLETKKTHVDDENCYFIKYSSNGVFDCNNNIPHITYSWITINPNNRTMISISGFCNINNYYDEEKWEPIFNDIVETFIFN